MIRPFLFVLLLLCVGAQGVPAQATATAPGLDVITPEAVASRIEVLAHDSMRGRDTPSPELDRAADWIAESFESFGLTGGGDGGSFLQHYSIQRVTPDFAASRIVAGETELRFGEDVALPFGLRCGGDFTAPIAVLTGTADMQEALRELDFSGRHLIVLSGGEGARGAAALQTVQAAARTGPLSVVVATDRSDGEWRRTVAMQEENISTCLPWDDTTGPPILEVRESAIAPFLSAHGVDLAGQRARAAGPLTVLELDGVEMTVSPRVRVLRDDRAPNVVGVLEGSDPELRGEHVVFSAHMDHVGVGRPDPTGDSIYNGADDNASGTAGVIALAEAFASMEERPARSLIFVLVSGEEKGLWGSQYYADHAHVPATDMVAAINMDMIGRNWPDTIVAIGKEHSDLGATLEQVNARHPELGMTAIDDLWPEERFYFRSDHYNFARKGVPILFFFNGVHEDYHRPSDHPEKIDQEKTARITRLVYLFGLEVANAVDPPRWNPESYREIVTDGS